MCEALSKVMTFDQGISIVIRNLPLNISSQAVLPPPILSPKRLSPVKIVKLEINYGDLSLEVAYKVNEYLSLKDLYNLSLANSQIEYNQVPYLEQRFIETAEERKLRRDVKAFFDLVPTSVKENNYVTILDWAIAYGKSDQFIVELAKEMYRRYGRFTLIIESLIINHNFHIFKLIIDNLDITREDNMYIQDQLWVYGRTDMSEYFLLNPRFKSFYEY